MKTELLHITTKPVSDEFHFWFQVVFFTIVAIVIFMVWTKIRFDKMFDEINNVHEEEFIDTEMTSTESNTIDRFIQNCEKTNMINTGIFPTNKHCQKCKKSMTYLSFFTDKDNGHHGFYVCYCGHNYKIKES